ncbi:hypothetical protein TA3x_003087 [Tundrisphaera sp. TA3]|uniref:hypothetical protein n=1 Tax=Tundrisphaera sp. TA3 TaxID=3435775 RepID=UPI003EB6E447
MNRKLKAILIFLGLASAALIIAQLVMGLMIVRAGRGGGDPTALARMIKMHQHSGYLAVTVSVIYITLSMTAIARISSRSEPINRV